MAPVVDLVPDVAPKVLMGFDPPNTFVKDEQGQRVLPLTFPEWIRWGVRRGGKFEALKDQDGRRQKGPNGRPHCFWCRAEVPKGRLSYCSALCCTYASFTWGWSGLREYVILRDQTCRGCASDFPGWRRTRVAAGVGSWGFADGEKPEGPSSGLVELVWEVDHILPVSLGGTDDPQNLRLLCWSCHQKETTKLAGILAKSKRIARHGNAKPQFDLLPPRA